MQKLICIVLVLATLLSCGTILGFAEESSNTFGGALEYDPDVAAAAAQELTPEEGELLKEKFAIMEQVKSEKVLTRAITWSHLPGTFPLYPQTTSYNCGPACVQSTIHYIQGSAPSQATIAAACKTTTNGTYLVDMVACLNSYQSKNKYVEMYQQDKSTMEACLYSAVHHFQVPAIIGFKCRQNDGWLYDSDGHNTCINAARDDRAYFQLADPLIGYLDLTQHYYQKSSSALYAAYSSINAGFTW